VPAAKVKVIELAKELGVTSKDLMVAAEEMGHKGIRAMSPLDSALANALRVKLGKGRELPEAPKPKRVAKAKEPKEGDDAAAAVDEAVAKKPARAKKAKSDEEAAADIKPAATIVKPKPAVPDVVLEPAPPAPIPEPEIVLEPVVVAPPPPEVLKPAATVAP
jgi:translation initiation factor IF-2